jgi:hypothetical protein
MTAIAVASALAATLVATVTVATWAASGPSNGNEIRLRASMVAGAASWAADYRERGNQRRLNVEAEDLANTTPSVLGVFVNASSQVGTMSLAACPTAPTLLCGEMELNTNDGQVVPVLKRGDVISIGPAANQAVLAGALR